MERYSTTKDRNDNEVKVRMALKELVEMGSEKIFGSYGIPEVKGCIPFMMAGYITNDEGLRIEFEDGKVFDITIQERGGQV